MCRYPDVPDGQVCTACGHPYAVCTDDACVSYAIERGYIADFEEWKRLQRQIAAQRGSAAAVDAAGTTVRYDYAARAGDRNVLRRDPGGRFR